MYQYVEMNEMIARTNSAASKPITLGIGVYVDSCPDIVGADFMIDPLDTKGIEIFKSFCQQMAEHYKHLNNKP